MSGSSPATPASLAVLAHGGPQWRRQARLARWLAWLSLAYMAAEGAIAVAAAVLAGSVALLGFGLDSVVVHLGSVGKGTGVRRGAPRHVRSGSGKRCRHAPWFLLAARPVRRP